MFRFYHIVTFVSCQYLFCFIFFSLCGMINLVKNTAKTLGGRLMTVGENIRRIRKERGLTQKQLGELVGASEAYIRAYESGRRNPKPSSLEKIANALAVNPEVLENSDFDMIKAMHRLFQIARQYNGHLFACKDEEGNDTVGIRFETLTLMNAWCQRYEKFLEDVEKCNEIKDAKKRGEALIKAETDYDRWMDTYPEQSGNTGSVK
ncbi:helix-turn-helix transcriptional regulator [Lachnospiraceae bacterium MD335]|nr:helix-turn-helix transcriptional regulator [Lachnospiraceae bacterium MD335]